MSRRLAAGPDAVSELTARRLSIYLRGLQALESAGVSTISSHDFARRFHLNSAQIRKDLALFGEFGIRGVGYDVQGLKRQILGILGLDSRRDIILCGAGHLGQALAAYGGFNSGGFAVAALFDVDPVKIGTRLRTGAPILAASEIPRFAKSNRVEIGVIAVPAEAAQRTFDVLVAANIRAILNFAPVPLQGPPGVFLKNVDLKIHLETLSFFLNQK